MPDAVAFPGLPERRVVNVALLTPIDAELRPDGRLLVQRCRELFAAGCDGVTLFGTTGEGGEFGTDDRRRTLDFLLAAGIDPSRIIVSVGALNLPDTVALAQHATAAAVAGVMLMPPCLYRSGIGEEGAFRFYATAVDRIARDDLRLLLYHFPDISGVAVTPRTIRRLSERYPRLIAGVKDSGGDLDYTEDLLRRFSHLSIFTGTEIHIPQALASGARGTICGLANLLPRLIRRMSDAATFADGRRFIPILQRLDNVLSRHPFIPSMKAVLASLTGEPAWRRVLPPMTEIGLFDEERLIADFRRLQGELPADWQDLGQDRGGPRDSLAAPRIVGRDIAAAAQ